MIVPSLYMDAHCHLADPRLSASLEAILARATASGIGRFIQGGIDPEDWDRQIGLCGRFPGRIIPCFGLHPWWVAEASEASIQNALDRLPGYLQRHSISAVGELGLDYATRGGDVEAHRKQNHAFRRQLAIGRASARPLVLHVVRAHPQALNILEENAYPGMTGIAHSFGGSFEIADRYIQLGFAISVGGSLVREKGFETLKRAVVRIPAGSLVLETDSPDQPPEGWAGEWNEPSSLDQVAQAVGRLRGEDPHRILVQSRLNLERVFGI